MKNSRSWDNPQPGELMHQYIDRQCQKVWETYDDPDEFTAAVNGGVVKTWNSLRTREPADLAIVGWIVREFCKMIRARNESKKAETQKPVKGLASLIAPKPKQAGVNGPRFWDSPQNEERLVPYVTRQCSLLVEAYTDPDEFAHDVRKHVLSRWEALRDEPVDIAIVEYHIGQYCKTIEERNAGRNVVRISQGQ